MKITACLVLALCMLLVPLSAAQAPKTDEWSGCALFRCNLHSHTRYSDYQGTSIDASGRNPWRAAECGLKNGLDALAVTDHGEDLGNYKETKVKVHLGMQSGTLVIEGVRVAEDELKGCLVGINNMNIYAALAGNGVTINGKTTALVGYWSEGLARGKMFFLKFKPINAVLTGKWEDAGSKSEWFRQESNKGLQFLLLRGFEWMDKDHQLNHANIIGSENYCDHQEKAGRLIGAGEKCENVRDLWAWIRKQKQSTPFVCQFNHPCTNNPRKDHFINYECPSPNMLDVTSGDRGWQEVDGAVSHFALIELNSQGSLNQYLQSKGCGNGTDPDDSNEYWYRLALRKGWRVGPGDNEDNHDMLHSKHYGATNLRTGVWVEAAKAHERASVHQAFMEALTERRTFSTEDKDIELRFWTEMGGQMHPMGSIIEAPSGSRVSFQVQVKGGDAVSSAKLICIRRNGIDERSFSAPARFPYESSLDISTDKYLICCYAKIQTSKGAYAVSAPIWVRKVISQGAGAGGSGAKTTTLFVMDCSESMSRSTTDGQQKLEAAKRAADDFLSLINFDSRCLGADHQVGLISFSDTVSEVLPFTSDLAQAREKLDSLTPVAQTDFGSALNKGISWFEALPDDWKGGRKLILFMSDGMTNTGPVAHDEFLVDHPENFPNALQLYQRAQKEGILVYTIGFGNPSLGNSIEEGLDEEVLKRIAQVPGTGGEYSLAIDAFKLAKVYSRSFHAATGNVVFDDDGTIMQGQEKKLGPFNPTAYPRLAGQESTPDGRHWSIRLPELCTAAYADGPARSQMLVTLGWEAGKLGLKLRDPAGKLVDESYPGAHIQSNVQPLCIAVDSPMPGNWTAVVTGDMVPNQNTRYDLIASARIPPSSGGGEFGGSASLWDDPFVTSGLVGAFVLGVLCSRIAVRRRRGKAPIPQQPIAWLQIHRQGASPQNLPIRRPVALIGRSESNDIVVADPMVSSQHVEIRFQGGSAFLRDLGSTNGTRVNSREVQQWTLQRGDQIQIGDTILFYFPPQG